MKTLWALLLAIPALTLAAEIPPSTTAIITNVRIIDGTGAPARSGAVRFADGRIVAVGDIFPGKTEIVIDGGGLTLAPGFIDTHSHHDQDISKYPDMVAVTSQGVTTIIIGQDGASPAPLSDFFAKLENTPTAVNIGAYSGHNTLRERATGAARHSATDEEIQRMSKLLEEDMTAGALGLSTGSLHEIGNVSTPSSEVLALAKVSARLGGRFISHTRDQGSGLMPSLQEVVEIGRQISAPVHVSNLKVAEKKLWGTSDKVLKLLDDARASGVDITADVSPYTYAESASGMSMRDDDVTRLIAWEHANICSAALALGHPGVRGTFPRVLGHYVREKKVLRLEQAVHKMSGLAAKHMGITDRGTIAPGAHADLVLFNPATVIDRATLQNPAALSAGIEKVWVNGDLVYQERRSTGARPGKVVRAVSTTIEP